jgi:hypothetical protein
MEPEISLPSSQQSAISLYPESDASSPLLLKLFPYDPF